MVITLTTDFGASSPYVAAMKGVILGIAPAAQLVDLSHAVPPQDIHQGAMALEQASPYFPPGTIHVAVVDPGVGTGRPAVAAEIGGQRYVAPDNGLLSLVARRSESRWIVRLEERRFWRETVSNTFHGRDIFAPVAAWLAAGIDPAELGPPQEALQPFAWPEPHVGLRRIEGVVLGCDAFGNALTSVTAEHLRDVPFDAARIACRGRTVAGIARTYGDSPDGTLVALVGSTGRLEVAVVGGSAARTLQVGPDEPVVVSW